MLGKEGDTLGSRNNSGRNENKVEELDISNAVEAEAY